MSRDMIAAMELVIIEQMMQGDMQGQTILKAWVAPANQVTHTVMLDLINW